MNIEEMIKNQNYSQMDSIGITDYYFDLIDYIKLFINKNYPLNNDDIHALNENRHTRNTKKRYDATITMKQKMIEILERQANENIKFLNQLESSDNLKEVLEVKTINFNQYNQQIFNYKQEILESLWKYKTKLVNDNEEELKGSIENGISGEAIKDVLEDVVNKSDEVKKIPEQLNEVVETIVEMKAGEEKEKENKSYSSNLVSTNSEKIKSALEEGIKAEEISATLIKETNKKGENHLPFIVRLVSKMKRKEKKIALNTQKTNVDSLEKGRQKVLK